MSSCCCAPAADNTSARFRRILWIALVANAAMFVVEVIASVVSGSVALQADALDFLGDAANYGITLLVLGMALRVRSSAALFKGATMAAFGVWVLGNAAYRAYAGSVPDAHIMGWIGALALVVNVAVAALLFRYRDGDSNRRSIWLCSRNDAVVNVAVIGAAGGVVLTGSGWPDLAVAGLVAALCLSSAIQVTRQALGELREGDGPPAAALTGISEAD